jgi:hypothetical protein
MHSSELLDIHHPNLLAPKCGSILEPPKGVSEWSGTRVLPQDCEFIWKFLKTSDSNVEMSQGAAAFTGVL